MPAFRLRGKARLRDCCDINVKNKQFFMHLVHCEAINGWENF